MTISIAVYRGTGTRDGGEVSESLLGDSLPAALARGRAELDAYAQPRRTVTLDLIFAPALRLGDLVEVDDPVQGLAWRGKVTGIRHRDDGVSLISTLTVERPL
jgi:hypothetical protein